MSSRNQGSLYRYGGEEVAECIRTAIDRLRAYYYFKKYILLGAASYLDDDSEIYEIIAASDSVLLEA